MAPRYGNRRTGHDGESGYDRLAVTIPRGLSRRLRRKAETGEARSISAFVAEAVEEKLERDDLQATLAEMIEKVGPPTPEEKAWVDEIVASVAEGRSPSTPGPSSPSTERTER